MNGKTKKALATLEALIERVEKVPVFEGDGGEVDLVSNRLESVLADFETLFESGDSGDAFIANLEANNEILFDTISRVEDLMTFAEESDFNTISDIVDDLFDVHDKFEEIIEDACE